MRELTIDELFKGYCDIIIPDEINCDAYVHPTISQSQIQSNSLLFITDKVMGEDHAYDASMLKAKPFAIVASHTKVILSPCVPIIRADNVRKALAYALSNSYGIDYGKIKIIGVTGTNGKTTTSTLIYEILRKCGYKTGFIGTGKIISNGEYLSQNQYSMTTPDPTVLYSAISKMAEDKCDYIVMEVSSHGIALGKVAPIKFEYAIFTNLDNDHLDFHGNMEDYFKTKLLLFSSAKMGLFNLDDKYSRRAAKLAPCKKSTFGILNQGDAYATEISIKDVCETSFYYREENLIFKAKTNLTGAFNVYNALAALRCVIDLGIKPCVAKKAIEEVMGIEGRMEIIDGRVKTIIDYAHTPSAFYNCLKTIKHAINTRQKLITVFGCGGDRDRLKRPIFGQYAEMLADIIIITEDNSRSESFDSIAKDITSGIKSKEFKIIPDRETAIRCAIKLAKEGDAVAIIGKGHEKYKIVGNKYIPFDERKIVIETLKEMDVDYASKA